MTPYEIGVLLDYATPPTSRSIELVREMEPDFIFTIKKFARMGLLQTNVSRHGSSDDYELSPLGLCYVNDGLCRVPLPEPSLRIPWDRAETTE